MKPASHPYVGLLRDPAIRTLWAGQALSDAGTELYRLGAIWLAVLTLAWAWGAGVAAPAAAT